MVESFQDLDRGDCISAARTLPARRTPAVPFELSIGTRLGRYEIVGRLGAGAMGLVFEAWDTELARVVALKLVHPSSEDLEIARADLHREFQVMARLSHANVAAVFDLGAAGACSFIAMELVRGGTLRDLIGPDHPWSAQLRTLIAAGRGLAAAHDAGVIHRDLKPENVLVRTDGAVRIADFGLACAAGDPAAAAECAGTWPYMAPESFEGVADAATDQFAFAATAFEVLDGRRPFDDGPRLDVHARCLRKGPRRPWLRRDLPPSVRAVIDRGLAIDPCARWPSMSALCAALAANLRIGGLAALPAPRAARSGGGRRGIAGACARSGWRSRLGARRRIVPAESADTIRGTAMAAS